nr:retrovirus-related Pol polyprotein from transposon TNT 1-94 [Tanacetum cinerariifolium]
MLTKSMATKLTAVLASERLFVDNLYEIEPKKVSEELKRPGWIGAMQDKLNQFYRNKHRTTTKNKARLVAQGYSQDEGINYDETFTPIARIETIRIFLAFATYMNFKVYQLDVKSTFLNGKLKEEVYVKQPPGFKSSEFPDYVCKLDKALQVPIKYLVENWFVRVPRNSNQWLCPQLKLNMLLLMGVVQVLDGNYSSTEQVNSIQQLLAFSLITMTEVDIEEIIYNDLGLEASGALFKKSKRPTSKKSPTETKVTLPKPIEGSEQSHSGQRLKGNKPPTDMERQNPTDVDLSRTGAEYQEDQTQSSRLRYQSLIENEGEPSYEWEPDTQPMLEDKPTSSTAPHTKASDTDSSSDKILRKYNDTLPYNEQKLVKLGSRHSASQRLSKSIKDDPATNKKTEEASETLAKIFTQTTEILSLVKSLNFSTLQSTIKNIQDYAFKQEEASAAWMKSSTNMAWNLAPLSSVTPIFALTNTPANVKGKNTTHTTTKEPPYHTEGETDANIQEKPKKPKQSIDSNIEFIGSSTPKDQRKLVKSLSIVCSDPDESIRVEFMINRKIVYLAEQEIQEYRDKEEEIKKAEEEARLNAISKTEVIKVICKKANKLGIHPKEAITSKVGKLFKKAQDDEHEVHKRQHTKKVRKSLKLKKHRYDSYMWTVNSRLKLDHITGIKIHPKTKPVAITVYKGTNGRNFDVHKPFLFRAFGISEFDELRKIIPKKKNAVVKDLMNSLSQRYERLRQIPRELRIESTLPAPEQTASQTSRKKQKHMKLEPKTRIPGLECNRALPENVIFVNNMVIEEPEYEIFLTDEFGDQAFQRWSDIDKVGMEALVSHLVVASMVKSPKNARFSMKLRKLIAEHLDQEKLKSKKVKLEALGYKIDLVLMHLFVIFCNR